MLDFFDWFVRQDEDTQFMLVVASGVFVLALARGFAKLFGGDK